MLRAGVKFDSQYNNTTADPPELVHFIRENYPSVVEWHPPLSMWQLIVKKRFPPTRKIRYCCEKLKEVSGKGRFVVTGVRWQESPRRKSRKMVEFCLKAEGKKYLHPIIDWGLADVWGYIRERKLQYCSLYDRGFKRIGCIFCPMSSRKEIPLQKLAWPRHEKIYVHTFDRMLEARILFGKLSTKWTCGQEVFDWWVSK
jgi:phosphoadenosine phosphosulfate reductase